jgi:S-(hydroxymethyl)glutathione dehydrogenase/alcohol dehydrogenase
MRSRPTVCPDRVRAAVLYEPGTALRVEEVLLDPPRAGEVRVRVAAAGVCHSDLHLADGHLGDGRCPTVLGHEGAGIVEAVGHDVGGLVPGDRIAFCFLPSCHACDPCLAGRFHLCETAAARSVAGTLLDGTSRLRLGDGRTLQHFNFISCFAERCVVPAACAVPIPFGLPLWQAALLGCSVVTGVGAVRNVARVAIGDSVCVIGCGGVGLQIVAAARMAGAGRIVAVDRDPAALARALRRGATHAVDASSEDTLTSVTAICPKGVDHAFEAVGRPETIREAWQVLRPGATAVVVGLVPKGVEVSLPGFDLLAEKGLKGCFYGSANAPVELRALAQLAVDGRLGLDDVISHITTLEGIEDAFERLRRGEGARTIVVLDPELAQAPE